jgi:hypothetical protein
LTQKDVNLPNGTIIHLTNKENQDQYWMIWWLEQIKTSGYHRYVVLKMNYYIEWIAENGRIGQWSYFSTPGTRAIRDSVVSGSAGAMFKENNTTMMFITPYQRDFERDTYLETQNGEKISAYRVTEFDNQATPGISYLSVESIPLKDFTPAPKKKEEDDASDFFWLQGGKLS